MTDFLIWLDWLEDQGYRTRCLRAALEQPPRWWPGPRRRRRPGRPPRPPESSPNGWGDGDGGPYHTAGDGGSGLRHDGYGGADGDGGTVWFGPEGDGDGEGEECPAEADLA